MYRKRPVGQRVKNKMWLIRTSFGIFTIFNQWLPYRLDRSNLNPQLENNFLFELIRLIQLIQLFKNFP